jgi:glycerol-3-phosphate acyltransferase PlsY
MVVPFFFAAVITYLLGAIPTAYLFGKILRGIDIRQYGSGNVGATNAFRVLGKIPGALVLLIDVAKGILALTLIGNMFGLVDVIQRILLGLIVVAGHNWTIFLKFKGGKGIATSLGVLIGLTIQYPSLHMVLLACLVGWIGVFISSGYVSLASMIAAIILPLVMWLTGQDLPLMILGVIFCIFVLFRHRINIQRLLAGKEHRVQFPLSRK